MMGGSLAGKLQPQETHLAPRICVPIGDNARTNTFMGVRLMPVTKRKATGAHFTPPDLARLVTERVAALVSGLKGPL